MLETKHEVYQNCDIIAVYKGIDKSHKYNYLIELRFCEDEKQHLPSYHKIKLDIYDTKKLTKELKLCKKIDKTRIYLAYCGHDIDIKREGEKFYIMHSPSSALYRYFYFELGKINELIEIFSQINQ